MDSPGVVEKTAQDGTPTAMRREDGSMNSYVSGIRLAFGKTELSSRLIDAEAWTLLLVQECEKAGRGLPFHRTDCRSDYARVGFGDTFQVFSSKYRTRPSR